MTAIDYKVESYDVQPNGKIKMSALMRVLQKIAGDDLDKYDMSYMKLYENNIAFVLTKITIRMYDDIKLFDNLIVETYPRPIKGAAFTRDFIVRKNGKVVVESTSIWALINLEQRKLLRPNILETLGTIETTTENSFSLQFVRRFPDYDCMNQTDVRNVTYSDLDMNGHLNNTFYANYVFDLLPDAQNMPMNNLFFEVNFKNEARLGEHISIRSTELTSTEIDFAAFKESDGKQCFTAYLNVNAESMG